MATRRRIHGLSDIRSPPRAAPTARGEILHSGAMGVHHGGQWHVLVRYHGPRSSSDRPDPLLIGILGSARSNADNWSTTATSTSPKSRAFRWRGSTLATSITSLRRSIWWSGGQRPLPSRSRRRRLLCGRAHHQRRWRRRTRRRYAAHPSKRRCLCGSVGARLLPDTSIGCLGQKCSRTSVICSMQCELVQSMNVARLRRGRSVVDGGELALLAQPAPVSVEDEPVSQLESMGGSKRG